MTASILVIPELHNDKVANVQRNVVQDESYHLGLHDKDICHVYARGVMATDNCQPNLCFGQELIQGDPYFCRGPWDFSSRVQL